MDIFQQAQLIVEGENLEDKLVRLRFTPLENNIKINHSKKINLIKNPGRSKNIKFSSDQLKFPNKNKLTTPEGTAIALHFFANHELLAIEMMAMAILRFPISGIAGDQFRKGLISTINDEQKHFNLYRQRMNELGIEFGDLPVNDFFWKQIHHVDTIESFYAMMALTFEAANLDFANHYKNIFKECDDLKTSDILSVVLEDEIRHVAMGWNYINQPHVINEREIWNYYLSLLPEKITPARSKGIHFDSSLRKQAGMSDCFIDEIKNFKSEFTITNRKS